MNDIKGLGLGRIAVRPFRRALSSSGSFLTIASHMIKLGWDVQPLPFMGLFVIQCIQGLVPLATAWVAKVLFDFLAADVKGQVPVQSIFLPLALQTILAVLDQLLIPVSQYLNNKFGRQISLHVKTTVYKKLNNIVGLAYFEDPLIHDTIQVVTNGASATPTQSLTTLFAIIQCIIMLCAFFSLLFALSPLIVVAVGIAALPQVYAQFKFSRQRFHLTVANSSHERRALYYGQILSWLQFAKEVRLFNLGDFFLRKFVQATQEVYENQRKQQKRETYWQTLFSFLTHIVSSATFIVVVVQAFAGNLSIGDVAFYMSAVASVQGSLIGIVIGLSQMHENVLFFQKYTALLKLEQPLPISDTPSEVPPLTYGITLRDVSFRYSENQPWILRHVDLFLPAGKCVALVGLNGAGKTTLVKLLTRLYDPTEGQILWDDIDLRDMDPQELRTRLGVIFQDYVRYDLSVQDNIGLGNIAQIENEEAIQHAAMKADIHQRIVMLEEGYQSILSRWLTREERAGVDFSGGEWQKIALARMFMREADVLVLDEPNAALDAQAEYNLYQHFRELMGGRTCLLITHRLSSVRMADYIAVLADGHAVEYGSHKDLIVHNGVYARLYAMQASSYQ